MAGVDTEIEVEVYEEADGEDMEPENLQKRTDKKSRSDIEVTGNHEVKLRQRRKQIRGKITRTINRLSLSIVKGELTKRRVDREMIDFRSDYKRVLDIHAELYDCENPDLRKLDHWEAELSNDIYTFEERVEDYIARLGSKLGVEVKKEEIEETLSEESTEMKFPKTEESVKNNTSTGVRDGGCAIDTWIDKLTEFQETQLPSFKENISIAEALFKLEANRDMPSVKLTTFDGSALKYVEFVETFKIHIHDKPNITDDMRMVQLRMHLSGDAERSISGLGTSGLVYATALKTLKEQFGQPSRIARTFIQKLTQEGRVRSNDRHGLRSFSQDIINCLATLKRINYLSDVNTIESLRKIVRRLPDHMIPGWKSLASSLRERGEVPNLEHISKFVRQRVQAEFDPDFGDIDQGQRSERDQRDSRPNTDRRKGVNSASQEHHPDNSSNQRASFIRCYICQMGHKEFECPTFLEATVPNRVEMIKSKKLCFSCLRGNHTSKQCYTRKVCTQPGCNRTHHPLIHIEPNRVSVASSPLDRDSIMPVVRVLFRAPNGRVLEGNVLIDGGAGTTIIQKDFARRLGLQGRREHLDIAVVGGKQLEQRDSRRLTFWISSLDGGEEFEIEAHELDKTVLSVPPPESALFVIIHSYERCHLQPQVWRDRPYSWCPV